MKWKRSKASMSEKYRNSLKNVFTALVMKSQVNARLMWSHSCKCLQRNQIPLLSDAELLMSPVMKEDSDCFLTVSFHIRRMRLCEGKKKKCQNVLEYSLCAAAAGQRNSLGARGRGVK